MGVEKEKLEQFAVVEMMGHRKIVGKITESDIGTGSLLKVTVLGKNGTPERTEYIGVASIYCLTIVDEEVAVLSAKSYTPEPTWAYGLSQRSLSSGQYEDDIDI